MSTYRKWLIMAIISVSGGLIFMLPFLQEVYYIPLAQALDLNNTQVGSLMSIFGTVSMLSYFPGGWLADRIAPRKLISASLLATGLAGLYFATFPSYTISLAIHAFWGASIALTFWGAMIRATRNWAPPEDQGKAFGILETGRGVGEVLPAMGILMVFAALGGSKLALSTVIVLYSCLIIALGLLSWFLLDDDTSSDERGGQQNKVGLKEIIGVLRMPMVWLITVVILTGYCAYWGLYRFTSFATDVFALSVTVGATIAIGKMWLKPIAAFVAGYVADNFGIAKSIAWLFVLLIASFLAAAALPGDSSFIPVMLICLTVASMAVFAMRGIYFALLEEGGVPMAVTGTATGVISAIAFTPDIFMPILGGVLLDNYPGELGYRYFFSTTAAICGIGLIAAIVIYRKIARRQEPCQTASSRQTP
jgi:nitrate/nitrite transporter NarK